MNGLQCFVVILAIANGAFALPRAEQSVVQRMSRPRIPIREVREQPIQSSIADEAIPLPVAPEAPEAVFPPAPEAMIEEEQGMPAAVEEQARIEEIIPEAARVPQGRVAPIEPAEPIETHSAIRHTPEEMFESFAPIEPEERFASFAADPAAGPTQIPTGGSGPNPFQMPAAFCNPGEFNNRLDAIIRELDELKRFCGGNRVGMVAQ
ncbi:nematocyst expressed protein 3-like [Topomyia yanbarensis]|uniref:nematocyst expressed protein 3-like n=1 Tax=Topomyia yanbarensis TaxID=2498891 RepID=UPI00273C23C3|nr:nematocyst expressed protein 3-like [Topomyia yanbarensis]